MSEFDALVAAAAETLAEELAREQRSLAPDFAAVVEEAHRRDPKRVSAAALAEVRALAPVVDLRSESRLSRREPPEFAALLAEARAEIAADTRAAVAAGPPGVPVPTARRSPASAWMWLAAAAAVAALVFGLQPLLGRGEATSGSALQAPWQDGASPPRHEVAPMPAPTPVPAKGGDSGAAEVVDAPAAEVPEVLPPSLEVDDTGAADDEAGEKSIVKRTGLKVPVEKDMPREKPGERLRRLGREAEAKWQAGDLAGAEALYREIIAVGQGSRAADLAYGDLFSLARQRHGADHEVALWREYLRVFPRGRYADDARAGLCRRGDDDGREACWRAYLADFPAGVHRHQASAALGTGR